MSVRPLRAALVAGALVMTCVVVLFCVREVPDSVVSLVGGPNGGVDRWGGLRVEYIPPADSEAEITAYLESSGARRDGNALHLEYSGIARDTVPDLLDVLVAGGLAMKECVETQWAVEIASDNPFVITELRPDDDESFADHPEPPDPNSVRLAMDRWRSDTEPDQIHQTAFLDGPNREAIQAAIDYARARGWHPPADHEIAFEDYAPVADRHAKPRVRTYLLASKVLIDGTMIDNATGTFEPNIGRAVVLLDLTQDGGEAFCELTARLSGRKIATVLGGRVRSAPVINGPICGGRASIAMGSSDPERQLRERDMLVEVLNHGALPRGGSIRHHTWTPPAETFVSELLGRLLLGLLAGLATAAIAFGVIRFARPTVAPVTHGFTGGVPWRRLAVTGLAPIALLGGTRLILPGLDEAELEHLLSGGSSESMSVIALGLTPVLGAYFMVELAALAIPPLRWRRHDPAGRIALGRATVILAIAFALVQGYFAARYLEGIAPGFTILSDAPGWKFRLIAMLSLTAGTLLLAMIAGLISEHGLGNGYAVLLATGIAIDLFPQTEHPLGGVLALEVVTFIVIAAAAMFVLRWRIAEARQPALRVPTSGLSPLADTAAFVSLVIGFTGLALHGWMFDLYEWSLWLSEWKVRLALIAISVPIWAWLFARPRVIERIALQGGLDRPTTSAWTRATVLSAFLLIGVAVLTTIPKVGATLEVALAFAITPVSALMFGAVLLDVIADARARRVPLAVAGVVHQPQYLGAIEHALTEANIPFHCHAAHVRTLYAFFAPWAPIHVLVPEDHAIEARLSIDGVLRTSQSTVPEARAR